MLILSALDTIHKIRHCNFHTVSSRARRVFEEALPRWRAMYFAFCVSHLGKDKIGFSIIDVNFLVGTAVRGTNHFNRTSRADAGFEKGLGIATRAMSQEMNKRGYIILLLN